MLCSKRYRILTLLFSIVICASMLIFAVSAENEFGEEPTDSAIGSTEASDFAQDTEPSYDEEEPSSEDEPYSETEEETQYTEPTEESYYGELETEPTEAFTDVPYVTDAPDYYPEDDNVASTNFETINDNNGYNDTGVLTPGDWAELSLTLNENADLNGGDDFSFIKNNNSTKNNGTWIMIVGILLVICSVAALVAFVMMSKKASAIKEIMTSGRRSDSRQNDDYGDSYVGRHHTPKRRRK